MSLMINSPHLVLCSCRICRWFKLRVFGGPRRTDNLSFIGGQCVALQVGGSYTRRSYPPCRVAGILGNYRGIHNAIQSSGRGLRLSAQIQRGGKLRVLFDRWHSLQVRRVSDGIKTRPPAGLGLVGVYGKSLIVASTRMRHIVRASPDRPLRGDVNQLDDQGGVYGDGGMQAMRRLPGSETHATHQVAVRARGLKG